MLDMKLKADRRELADRSGIAVEVLDMYRPALTELDAIDDGGEDCQVCALVGAVVEVHWYGSDDRAVPVDGQCCRQCVRSALALGAVDPYQPVEIEYLPLVARAGVGSVSDFRYFEAPNYYRPEFGDPPAVFLAGGITNCPAWHQHAVQVLRDSGVPMVVLNPARADFPIHDPQAGREQVTWEQHHLHLLGLITMMWFPASDPAKTTQPIAQFEFGQAIGEGRRLLVGADPGYPRCRDVEFMVDLNRPELTVHGTLDNLLAAVIREVRDVG